MAFDTLKILTLLRVTIGSDTEYIARVLLVYYCFSISTRDRKSLLVCNTRQSTISLPANDSMKITTIHDFIGFFEFKI